MASFDWSPLEQAGGDAAVAAPLFKALETHAATNPPQYAKAHEKLMALLATKPDARRAAAAVALPFLYSQACDPQQRLAGPLRALPLQLVAVLALGQPCEFVPHGVTPASAAHRNAPAHVLTTHARVAATAAAHLVPLLEDPSQTSVAVRSAAAFVLAFCPAPATRDAALPPLLAMVENEVRAEPRLTAMVAAAMLQRGAPPGPPPPPPPPDPSATKEKSTTSHEAFVAQLATRCQRVRALGAGNTEADVAEYGLAAARCILGVHAPADAQLLIRSGSIPRHLHDIPRVPDQPGPPELPFADPNLGRLAFRILAHLPGPAPQPTETVFALATAMDRSTLGDKTFVADAVLRSACGARPDDTNAVPQPWPAYADLDDRMGAAFRAIQRQEPMDILCLVDVLRDWDLPMSHRGLKAYMAGKREAKAPDRPARTGCYRIGWIFQACFSAVCGTMTADEISKWNARTQTNYYTQAYYNY